MPPQNKCNVGYAFINFIEPETVASFVKIHVNKEWVSVWLSYLFKGTQSFNILLFVLNRNGSTVSRSAKYHMRDCKANRSLWHVSKIRLSWKGKMNTCLLYSVLMAKTGRWRCILMHEKREYVLLTYVTINIQRTT